MQSAASRRAISYLASKIHPQLPLSPRESAQLLTLLTTSFRAHLDRAHPVADSEHESSSSSSSSSSKQRASQAASHGRFSRVSPAHAHSSQASARDHVESILTNPLLAARPQRRASDASKADAQSVLRDPLGWFLDQVAIGAADLSKAVICLQMLRRTKGEAATEPTPGAAPQTRPAAQIAAWLTASGLDRSREFVSYEPGRLLGPLATMLFQEGEDAVLWEWFAYDSAKRIEETGLEEFKVRAFRAQLLRAMVATRTRHRSKIDEALAIFLRATKMLTRPEFGLDTKTLQPAGFYLVNHVLARSQSASTSELYEAFLQSTSKWTAWSRGIQAILWLHHPTQPSATQGIDYIRDPNGMAKEIRYASASRRKFLVHLCLGAARQCLAEGKYSDGAFALEFARDTFPDLVGSPPKLSPADQTAFEHQKAEENRRKEEENLELLDRLLPT